MKKWLASILTLTVAGILIGTVIIPAIAQGGGDNVDIPTSISYQGYLTDKNGTPVLDPVDITFTLYTEINGGTAVWSEVHTEVDPNEGLFSVELGGNGSPMSAAIFDGDRYLGVKVGDDAEMTQRQKLSSVIYAFVAEYANTAGCAYTLSAPDGSPADAVYVDNEGKVGINTGSPQQTAHINGVMRLEPQSSEPSGGRGDLYASDDGNLYFHRGSSWQPIFITFLAMVPIAGGTFSMGDITGGDGDPDELPIHTVTLSPFKMAKTEVTFEQWIEVKTWAESNGYTFNMPGDMGSEDFGGTQDETHPVTDIEWYDSVLWCNALSEKERLTPCYYTSAAMTMVYRSGQANVENDWVDWNATGYRLPTEAEWEYACRADTTTKYNVGDTLSVNDANYWDSGDSYDNGTTPVGYYPANAWGLIDMHGNVWDWCWDWHSSDYYSSSPATDPRGPATGSLRVNRGGSWDYLAVQLRSAFRSRLAPDIDYYDLGLRPVRSSS